jgi:hypothetical protein
MINHKNMQLFIKNGFQLKIMMNFSTIIIIILVKSWNT